jgi:hypothetical protein
MKKSMLVLLLLLLPTLVHAQDFSTPYFDIDRVYYACDFLVDEQTAENYEVDFRSCMSAFDRCDAERVEDIVRFLVRPEYRDDIIEIVLSDCGVSYSSEYLPDATYGRAIFSRTQTTAPSAAVFLGALVGVIGVFVLLMLAVHRSK